MQGQIHIYTGDGKGKTTAALGLALRAAGQDKKIAIIFFDKGYPNGEFNSLSQIDNIEFYNFGENRIEKNKSFRLDFNNKDKKQQNLALIATNKILKKNAKDMLILDEILQKNMDSKNIQKIITKKPPELELILTGRFCPSTILQQADLITEMKKIRHYFDKGLKARTGIEY